MSKLISASSSRILSRASLREHGQVIAPSRASAFRGRAAQRHSVHVAIWPIDRSLVCPGRAYSADLRTTRSN